MSAGEEWLLPVDPDLTSLRECVETICGIWPEAVVEDVAAGEFAHSVEALLPTDESELCVYRDLEVTRRWQNGSPLGEMRSMMVQVSLNPYGVRVVAEDWRDPALDGMVRHLKSWQESVRTGAPNERPDEHSPG